MSKAIQNDGGSAYPSYRKGASYPHDLRPIGGMSLRDYFAAQALAGIMADPTVTETANGITETCYQLADAMLAAREAK